MTDFLQCPPGWTQRAGRTVSFPPGIIDEDWELVLDREPEAYDWTRYHVNGKGEVYRQEANGFYQPLWEELPMIVRQHVWDRVSTPD